MAGQKIEIYRKGNATPIRLDVKSVQPRTSGTPPSHLTFKTEDDKDGTIYLRASELEAVIITPTE